MNKVNFNLNRYRLEKVSAQGVNIEANVPNDIEMKFAIGFHHDSPDDCHFTVSISLDLNRIKDNEVEEVASITAVGAYRFEEGVEPYEIQNRLERAYAIGLLYGSMRTAVETIIGSIGFDSLSLPLTLPAEITQGNSSPSEEA